jgi:hypothetical protein
MPRGSFGVTAKNFQGGFMLDLASLTEDFIRNGFQKFDRDYGQDEATVGAVGAADVKRADHEKQLRKWLTLMRVFRFLPEQTRRDIVKQILKYADGSRASGPLHGKAAILSEYEKLRQRIQDMIGSSQKSSKPMNVISLTSKALWCCYPRDVPIFDANAYGALRVISRPWGILPEPGQDPTHFSWTYGSNSTGGPAEIERAPSGQ